MQRQCARHTLSAVDSGEVRRWWRRTVKKTSRLESRVLELEDALHEAEDAFQELQRTRQQVSALVKYDGCDEDSARASPCGV